MAVLIIETLVLALIAVAAGVLVGVLVKQWFGRRTIGNETLSQMMQAVVAAELAEAAEAPPAPAPPAPASDVRPPLVPAAPPPILEDLSGPAAEVSAGLDRIAAADKVGERPSALAGPRRGSGDNLRRIKGVGPQNATRLNALGIYHFDQIAAWTPAEARWIGTYLAFPGRIEREDWIGQAKAVRDADDRQ